MIKKEEDYSKPVLEIDYETKQRKKRRRGEVLEEEPKERAPPYRREKQVLPNNRALSLYEELFEDYQDYLDEGPWIDDMPDETELARIDPPESTQDLIWPSLEEGLMDPDMEFTP